MYLTTFAEFSYILLSFSHFYKVDHVIENLILCHSIEEIVIAMINLLTFNLSLLTSKFLSDLAATKYV